MAAQTVRRVHLVYPHGNQISCPRAIGRELAARLRQRYDVVLHDWAELKKLTPEPGDALIGHPHPAPYTVFRASVGKAGWTRRLVLSPFNCDLRQVAFLDPWVRLADLYLAITGPYWMKAVEHSELAHWAPKMWHMDLAVNRDHFPPLKPPFHEPGQRAFVYIGYNGWTKNPKYLAQIAAAMPGTSFGWIGGGRHPIPGFHSHGTLDFSTPASHDILKQYDFLLSVSLADANPATILEAMSWGLIPVCTPQSGYSGIPSIPNVPVDLKAAVNILNQLQHLPASDLHQMQSSNWALLEQHYNWDRFAGQVVEALESRETPPCPTPSLRVRWKLTFTALRSRYAFWRPGMLAMLRSARLRNPFPRRTSR